MGMKKLWSNVITWFVFTFRNPSFYKEVLGGFKVEFRRFWLDIRTLSGNFRTRIMISEHPYGYLFFSLKQGKIDNIRGYCQYLYSVSMALTTDQKLANEIQRSLNRSYDRRLKQEMMNESKDKDDESAIAEVMAEKEYAGLSRRERRKASRDLKKELKNGRKENN